MSQIKKIVCLAALPCLFATSSQAAPQVQQRYPTPSGRVVYRMSMAMGMNSNITTSWTDYGRKFRQDIKMTMNMPMGAGGAGSQNKPMVINSWAISDGNYMYSAMPGQRKALRMPIPTGDFAKIPGMDSLKQMGMIGSNPSSKVIGKGMVLGKPTTIRSIVNNAPKMSMNGKVWMWGGLPLRMDMTVKMKGMPTGAKRKGAPSSYSPPPMTMSMVATKLDLNAKPSPSLFKLPSGYAVQDMADFQKQMQGRMQQRRR